MTSPMMLFGVDAPAVRPIIIGPAAGSQPELVVSLTAPVEGAPTGRCRIPSADTRQDVSAMW